MCILNRGQVVSYGTPARVRADLVDEYLVVDAADHDQLRQELAARGAHFEETPQFKISLDGRSVHELLKAIDTPLTTVETRSPSLEDAYLALVAHDEEEEE